MDDVKKEDEVADPIAATAFVKQVRFTINIEASYNKYQRVGRRPGRDGEACLSQTNKGALRSGLFAEFGLRCR